MGAMTDQAFALISRAGRAVVRRGETFFVLTVESPDPQPADGTHWSHLRALHPLAEIVPADEHPFPEVRARMRETWREQLGLSLLLTCFDREHDDDFRRETCTVVEQLLADEPWLLDRLREIVLSIEPPPEADLAGAKIHADAARTPVVAQLVGDLIAARETIAAVRAAWQECARSLGTPAERSEAITAADGLFAVGRAVMALRDPDPAAWDALRGWCRETFEPEVAKATTDAAAVIERWLSALDRGRATTKQLLDLDDATTLASSIRARLSEPLPSDVADRCRCEAIVRAAERCRISDDRARFAEAMLSLLGDLVVRPDAIPASVEWPAGLFVLARHVAWTDAECAGLRRLLVSVLYHVRHDRSWSLGAPKGSVLGSAVLEAHRAARFAGIAAEEHRASLEASLDRLASKGRLDADPEAGCLLGVLSSYAGAEARMAAEWLRPVDIGARSQVLAVVEREHRAWAGHAASLADAVLGVFGGKGEVKSVHRPTAAEQRWAAEAVRSFGALSPEHTLQVEDLVTPQLVAVKATIKAPSFATGKRKAAA